MERTSSIPTGAYSTFGKDGRVYWFSEDGRRIKAPSAAVATGRHTEASKKTKKSRSTKTSTAPRRAGVFLGNPAAIKCINKGHQHFIRRDPDGSERGICKLGDGTECDEWAFYSDRCPEKGSSTSAETKTTRKHKTSKKAATSEEKTVCGTVVGSGKVHRTDWTDADNRQYEHILVEQRERGKDCKTAKRIAAATVNRNRAVRATAGKKKSRKRSVSFEK